MVNPRGWEGDIVNIWWLNIAATHGQIEHDPYSQGSDLGLYHVQASIDWGWLGGNDERFVPFLPTWAAIATTPLPLQVVSTGRA